MFLQETLVLYSCTYTAWIFSDGDAEQAHHFSDKIDRTGHYHDCRRPRRGASPIESRLNLSDRLNLSSGAASSLLNLFRRRRPWILGPRGDNPIGQRE